MRMCIVAVRVQQQRRQQNSSLPYRIRTSMSDSRRGNVKPAGWRYVCTFAVPVRCHAHMPPSREEQAGSNWNVVAQRETNNERPAEEKAAPVVVVMTGGAVEEYGVMSARRRNVATVECASSWHWSGAWHALNVTRVCLRAGARTRRRPRSTSAKCPGRRRCTTTGRTVARKTESRSAMVQSTRPSGMFGRTGSGQVHIVGRRRLQQSVRKRTRHA